MGRSFAATTFLSAGNITHTPAYGCLIALGVLGEVQERNASQQQIDNALAYRDHIARTGRFLTFSSGAATIGARMRPEPGRPHVAAHRARDRYRPGDQRQGRHAHQPALRRGRLCRRPVRRRFPGPPRHLRRAGERARRHRDLPPHFGPPCQPVPGAAVQPL